MTIVIRAIPAAGAEYRFRSGRGWSKTPTLVEVVEANAGEGQITRAQLEQLRGDPLIAIESPAGQVDEVEVMKARLRELEIENAELRAALDEKKAQKRAKTE